ncbi:MAG: TIGR01777 family oxidoreductase [Desulfobulbus sp.]
MISCTSEPGWFSATSVFPCSAKELYNWHRRPGALERLIPPWERTTVVARSGGIDPGGRVTMRMHLGPVPYLWQAQHIENKPYDFFRDTQIGGPFRRWVHTHRFSATPEGACLQDQIEYALPGQSILPWVSRRLVEPVLIRTFRYRHATLRDDLLLHSRASRQPLRILVSGASGVLGSALVPLLSTGGHEVWRLVRRKPESDSREVYWDPARGEINLSGLPPFDGVIHLAADNIGEGRWTAAKRQRMLESRIQGTDLLVRELARSRQKPKVLLSASAVGFYGDCQDRWVHEDDPPGNAFISEICSRWEQAARPAEDADIRTAFLRIGVVLSPRGGALAQLLAASAAGVSRRFGSGGQYISWIGLHDAVGAMLHVLSCNDIRGPINIVAPEPVTNSELLATLARIMRRPLLPPTPAPMVRLVFGQRGTELLLEGCRASADKLLASGYRFRHPNLAAALGSLLGRP